MQYKPYKFVLSFKKKNSVSCTRKCVSVVMLVTYWCRVFLNSQRQMQEKVCYYDENLVLHHFVVNYFLDGRIKNKTKVLFIFIIFIFTERKF